MILQEHYICRKFIVIYSNCFIDFVVNVIARISAPAANKVLKIKELKDSVH